MAHEFAFNTSCVQINNDNIITWHAWFDYHTFSPTDQRDDVLYGLLNTYVSLEKVRVGDHVLGDHPYQGQFLEALDLLLSQVGELQLFTLSASSLLLDGLPYHLGDGHVHSIRYNPHLGGVSCLEDVRISLMQSLLS